MGESNFDAVYIPPTNLGALVFIGDLIKVQFDLFARYKYDFVRRAGRREKLSIRIRIRKR